MTDETKRKNKIVYIILINVFSIFLIIISFGIYNKGYQDKLSKQNINDIVNINQSAANISSAFFASQKNRLLDIAKYVTNQPMKHDELLDYIERSVYEGESSFQLIGTDCQGGLASRETGDYIAVDYTSQDYGELIKIFKNAKAGEKLDAAFVPEFTDNHTGSKSFALYCYVPFINESEELEYATLLAVSNTAYFREYINVDGGFKNFSTVLIDENGDYVLGNSAFKSTNFFQYLYIYNDLSMDEKNEIEELVNGQQKGELYYQNSTGEDCVFVYTKMPESQWYSVSSVPITSFHGQTKDIQYTVFIVFVLVFMMMVDLNWMRHTNRELQKSVKIAEKANMAKTDFLSQMSHDIRTPMNVINGMTYLALHENDSSMIPHYLGNIQSASEFLTGLVNDILDLNKVESGKMELHPQSYSFKKFTRYIEAIVLPQCEKKHISFVMEKRMVGTGLLMESNSNEDKKWEELAILIDTLRLNQIFFNLLSNAVKFTQEGGHIYLKIEAENYIENKVRLNFVVQDDGIGMSEKFQEHMFEAFSQEKSTTTGEITGTGLGLTIVKNLVELMNGTLRVESELGKGSAFFIQLETIIVPCAEELVGDGTVIRERLLQNKRILLCEDHPMNREIVVCLLEDKGMLVDTANDGAEGVKMFIESEPGYYSAILMDVMMPVMDGITATREIRSLTRIDAKEVPIIAMTANAYDMDVQRSMDAGMNAHLAKPIEPEKVFETLAYFLSIEGFGQ